jgi:hypothetical protein
MNNECQGQQRLTFDKARIDIGDSLSSGNTSNVFVSDLCVDGMRDTEDAHDDITGMISKLPTRQPGRRMFMLRHGAWSG